MAVWMFSMLEVSMSISKFMWKAESSEREVASEELLVVLLARTVTLAVYSASLVTLLANWVVIVSEDSVSMTPVAATTCSFMVTSISRAWLISLMKLNKTMGYRLGVTVTPHGVSNRWHLDWLFNSLFKLQRKHQSHYWPLWGEIHVAVVCAFSSQRFSNIERISMSWSRRGTKLRKKENKLCQICNQLKTAHISRSRSWGVNIQFITLRILCTHFTL